MGSRTHYIVICTLLLTILTVSSLLVYLPEGDRYRYFKSSVQGNREIQVTQIPDDNEEALLKLGLTPHHSVNVHITDLEGNDVKQTDVVYHGRFLHITDMHPDELNKVGSSIPRQCHKMGKNVLGSERSHTYGDAMSGCDSPMGLYEETLAWIRENLKDKIDFVIWTGDNVRHDNDRNYPRLETEIFKMNQRVADKMGSVFMDDGEEDMMPQDRRVKIVPSLGNNDVYPHNLVAPGPTLQTREMYKIWRDFVPAEQMHTFDRGIYFFREVIPGRLAVLSINTLYVFKSNPLNDNCDGRKQPGYKLFEWLSVTLKELRRRHMKVWLSGHVPPIPKNLHYSCYSKMTVWMHEYRDIIIGGLWGHMNTDHFVPLDSVKAWRSIEGRLKLLGFEDDADSLNYSTYGEDESETEDEEDDEIDDYKDVMDMYSAMGLLDEDFGVTRKSKRYDGAPVGKVTYLEGIRDTMLAKIKGKKKSGEHGDRYSFAHVTVSVIPTYNPGFRVWEYNVTELLGGKEEVTYEPWDEFFARTNRELDKSDELAEMLEAYDDEDPRKKQYYSLGKDSTIPPIMPAGTPLGPGYVKQLFSPERYVQYYLDLDKAARDPDAAFNYGVHYATDDETYNMKGLLAEDWIRLARRLAKSSPVKNKPGKKKKDKKKKKKPVEARDLGEMTAADLWSAYVDRAFISTGYEDHSFAN